MKFHVPNYSCLLNPITWGLPPPDPRYLCPQLMTNKLAVIINSLKVPKIKKNFAIRNEISCTKLQLLLNPITWGLPPPDPRSVCPLS